MAGNSISKDSQLDTFLEYLSVEKNCSHRTLANYHLAITRFRAWLPTGKPWEVVDADDFRDYLFHCMREEWARATVRLHFAAGASTNFFAGEGV